MSNYKTNINRAAFNTSEFAKDTVTKNLMAAVRENKLSLKPELLGPVIQLVKLSIDEAFSKAQPAFEKTVDESFAQAASFLLDSKSKK